MNNYLYLLVLLAGSASTAQFTVEVGGRTPSCYEECTQPTGYSRVCSSLAGCEACPFEETCEKLCKRCRGGEFATYGGLDCDCSFFPSRAPTPSCHDGCYATFPDQTWVCDTPAGGCDGCPEEDKQKICSNLCIKCYGHSSQSYQWAGLDCVCHLWLIPGCFAGCYAEQGFSFVCDRRDACSRCRASDVCGNLCKKCAGREGTWYGGQDCDCGPCWPACSAETGNKWVCNQNHACSGCNNDEVCNKLCERCGLPAGTNEVAGLTCNCPVRQQLRARESCWEACGLATGGEWICNRDGLECADCDNTNDVCRKLCSRCGLRSGTRNVVAGLSCTCP